MNKPTYAAVARERGFIIHSYAVEEQYEGEAPFVCTAGHPTRIAAEASAAALQGAIERFARRQSDKVLRLQLLIQELEHNRIVPDEFAGDYAEALLARPGYTV